MKKSCSILSFFILVLFIGCSEYDMQPFDNGNLALEKSKSHEVPFKSTFDIWLDQTLAGPPYLHQIVLGSGNATHLGLTGLRVDEVIDLTGFPWFADADVIFTAANGDQLFVEYESDVDPTLFPDLTIEGTGTFTGGTGRFVNSSGDVAYKATWNVDEGKGKATFTGIILYGKK